MRCPNCGGYSFDSDDRCRGCGYSAPKPKAPPWWGMPSRPRQPEPANEGPNVPKPPAPGTKSEPLLRCPECGDPSLWWNGQNRLFECLNLKCKRTITEQDMAGKVALEGLLLCKHCHATFTQEQYDTHLHFLAKSARAGATCAKCGKPSYYNTSYGVWECLNAKCGQGSSLTDSGTSPPNTAAVGPVAADPAGTGAGHAISEPPTPPKSDEAKGATGQAVVSPSSKNVDGEKNAIGRVRCPNCHSRNVERDYSKNAQMQDGKWIYPYKCSWCGRRFVSEYGINFAESSYRPEGLEFVSRLTIEGYEEGPQGRAIGHDDEVIPAKRTPEEIKAEQERMQKEWEREYAERRRAQNAEQTKPMGGQPPRAWFGNEYFDPKTGRWRRPGGGRGRTRKAVLAFFSIALVLVMGYSGYGYTTLAPVFQPVSSFTTPKTKLSVYLVTYICGIPGRAKSPSQRPQSLQHDQARHHSLPESRPGRNS